MTHRPDRRTAIALMTIAVLPVGMPVVASDVVNDVATRGVIPEIVVSADFRDSRLLKTDTSLTVIDEDTVDARAAGHLEDIIALVPNMNYAGGSNRARFFQIRGIGERSQFVDPINPSVGVIVDGIDFSGAGTIGTLFDVKQVEVLRGPQGTLYGANALAGLVNLTTHEPGDEFEAKVQARIADYGTKGLGAVLSGPLTNRLGGRIVVEQNKSDGYIKNRHLGLENTNNREESTVRAKLNWQVWDTWHFGITAFRIDIDNGYDAFSLDNTRSTFSDEPGFDRQISNAVAVDSEMANEYYDLYFQLTAASSDMAYGYDEDWSFTGIHPDGYTSTDHYLRDRKTNSLELRLISNENSRLMANSTDWLVGVYRLQSEESLDRIYTYAGPFNSQYDFETTALFGQLDIEPREQWMLSAGLRWEQRQTHYTDNNLVNFSPTDDMWGGRISLQYFPEDLANAMMYFSVARGYKAGGFNTDGTLDVDLREFSPEYLTEWELGFKGSFMENQLRISTAIFIDDRRDQQVKSSLVRARPNGSSEFIDFVGNAALGTNKGFEVEVIWQLHNHLQLFANAGILDATFDRYINEFGSDLSGRDQAHAPAYTYHTGVEYQRSRWRFRLQLEGRDAFYFSDRHDIESEPYDLVNFRIQYEADQWQLSLWGRNLADKDYFVRGFGSFGNDPRKGYITEPYYQFGEPRILGITFDYSI